MTKFIASRADGRICLIGAPFDSTTSYRPGARFGPNAVREASQSLETFSFQLKTDLEDCSFMDAGDLELPFGDPKPALEAITQAITELLARDKIPFLIGGEHLASLGSFKAVEAKHKDLKLIHLDAHADLRESYLGQHLSHATVIRRMADIIGLDSIRQYGIRSGTHDEYLIVKSLRAEPEEIISWAEDSPCYITCDLDILDPAVLPGTGTPEPGGISYQDLVKILANMIENLNVVAMDVVELAPHYDSSGISCVVAAKIVRECLIALSKD
jgi:agmatinase